MKLYALIVAGGSGIRMGSEIPKQFLLLAGKPLLMHTIERFVAFDRSVNIIVVLPENHFGYWNELREKYSFTVPHILVQGGEQRFFSVKNGLDKVDDDSLVAVHDGVRPLVSIPTIRICFETAGKYGNAVPVTTPPDSVRMITENGNISVNRHDLRIIQTPQVFYSSLIKKAYLQDYSPEITDDSMLLEMAGERIHLVEGNRENIKITNPGDLLIARALLNTIS